MDANDGSGDGKTIRNSHNSVQSFLCPSLSYVGCHANKENVMKCKASSQFLSVACLPLRCLGHKVCQGVNISGTTLTSLDVYL